MIRRSLPIALLAGVTLAAGCAGSDGTSDGTPQTTTAEAVRQPPADVGPTIRVGLVTGLGGADDPSFDGLAEEGLARATSELGVHGQTLEARTRAEYVPT